MFIHSVGPEDFRILRQFLIFYVSFSEFLTELLRNVGSITRTICNVLVRLVNEI